MLGLLIALKKANMKQKDLASRLKVSEAAVSSWVSGLHKPTIETIKEIAKIIDVEVNEIIRDY